MLRFDATFPVLPEDDEIDAGAIMARTGSGRATTTVISLTGETVIVPWAREMLVKDFQQLLAQQITVEPCKQRLVYKGQNLSPSSTMGHFNVQAGGTITLIVVMASLQSIKAAKFNLGWTFSDFWLGLFGRQLSDVLHGRIA